MIIWRYVCACSVTSFMSDCKPMDCSPPGSSGILQARILEWMSCPPPRDLPDPGMEPTSPALQADSSPTKPSGKTLIWRYLQPKLLKHFKQKDALDKFQIAFQRQLFIFLHLQWGKKKKKAIVQFSSVAQLCLALCDPMDCSMPGLPIHCQLPEFTQTHVHWVGDAIQSSHALSSPSPTFNLYQHLGLSKWVSSSHQMAKVLEF